MPDREPALDSALARELITAMDAMRVETVAVRERAEALVPAAETEVKRARVTRVLLGLVTALVITQGVLGTLFYLSTQRSDRAIQDGLCPILFRVAANYAPDRFPPGPEKDRYDDDIRQIVLSYRAFGCRGELSTPVPLVGN